MTYQREHLTNPQVQLKWKIASPPEALVSALGPLPNSSSLKGITTLISNPVI